ncbi:hypothetical protein AC579_176 [Pseudocercospora musae]|uniref:Uncharacterized protein n=1 Tax=Pseudocercospora musae TaxID=113226 RepID=A0A139I0R7_9PEZI|nr:hypothetical protein AC579_176 [Pseudocercospora musae]
MSIPTNTTNEPTKLYSSLTHEQMRDNMRITWKSEIEDKLYQFCGQEVITAKSVPSAHQCIELMQFIGFDTEDTDVYKNALTKVVAWITSHMSSSKLSSLVKEVFEPGKKLAPADVSVHTWMTTWRSTGYSPTKNGFDVPVTAPQQSWTPIRRVTPVGQLAVVSQGCAMRFAGIMVSTSTMAPAEQGFTTSTSVPIVMPTAAGPVAAPVVKILPSKFHTDMIEVMTDQTKDFTPDQVSTWLNDHGRKFIESLLAQVKAANATAPKLQNLSSHVAALKDEVKLSKDEAKKSNVQIAALETEIADLNNHIAEIKGDARKLDAEWRQREDQSQEIIKQLDAEISQLKVRNDFKGAKQQPPSPPTTPMRSHARTNDSLPAPRGQRVRFASEEADSERDIRAQIDTYRQQASPTPDIDDILRGRFGMPQGSTDYPVLPSITDMEAELRKLGVNV